MLSLSGRLTLRELLEQAWKQVHGQVLEVLQRTVEGLLVAERDRSVQQARAEGQKVYRWGYTVRKSWATLWGELRQVRVPRLRGRQEIALLEKYERHALGEVLFALTVGGLSQRKVVDWMRRFLGFGLSPATLGAVLEQAQAAVAARRAQPLSAAEFPILVVDAVRHRYRRRAERGPRRGVLLIAVGVRRNGSFQVLDWQAAPEETTEAYEQLFTRLWQRGLERVELITSDGCEAITSAAAIVYPTAAHQLCLLHWFWNLEKLTPPLAWWQRRKFRREFWWIWEGDDEAQVRRWAAAFCRRWRFAAPLLVEKFQAELPRVLAYLRWPATWRHRLRTSNLAEGFFRHLRKYLGRFPGCVDPAHAEQVLGCFVLAAEQMHA